MLNSYLKARKFLKMIRQTNKKQVLLFRNFAECQGNGREVSICCSAPQGSQ